MEIKSANQILNEANIEFKDTLQQKDIIITAMNRYAVQYIELCASKTDANKEQILNIKNKLQ